ncbi:MAG: MmcQ/YjbR family DNA-binding protein [Bacillota bacterium]|nr:MmcQ/YjbR family DNA-binding protein [Bacillota bacterium]
MNRAELKTYIEETYVAESEFPWMKFPTYEVFRHKDNRKWFAVIMDISMDKLGLQGREKLSVVNLKCDPILIGSLLLKQGFFPAYHMNKGTWITIALDGSVPAEEIKILLDMSFELTAVMKKRKTSREV